MEKNWGSNRGMPRQFLILIQWSRGQNQGTSLCSVIDVELDVHSWLTYGATENSIKNFKTLEKSFDCFHRKVASNIADFALWPPHM